MTTKILFVDDDSHALTGYRRMLQSRFCLETALGGEEGLATINNRGPFAVVVADMRMPGMNGIQFLTKVEQSVPDTVRIMLTGNADLATASDAVNRGHVFRFLTKPCPLEIISPALESAIKQYLLITGERELLENTLNGSIKMLTDILAMSNPAAFGRAQKLRQYVCGFARHFGLTQTWDLEMAAMLSSIGCVALPGSVITRADDGLSLSVTERQMLTRIPEIGSKVLANIPRLDSVARIVLYQNKQYDGAGFPGDSVMGEEIPIGSRILRLMTDLLIMEGCKMTREEALEKMKHVPGRYDPKVLDAVAGFFDLYLGAAKTEVAYPVLLKDLCVGDALVEGATTLDGLLIAPPGVEVGDLLLEKLHNFAGVTGVKEPLLIARQAKAPQEMSTAL